MAQSSWNFKDNHQMERPETEGWEGRERREVKGDDKRIVGWRCSGGKTVDSKQREITSMLSLISQIHEAAFLHHFWVSLLQDFCC